MTVPCLTQSQFLDYIKCNGWDVVSTDYWEKYDRLVLEKNDTTFVFQLKQEYFYLEVIETCKLLKIQAPEDHSHEYYLHKRMYDHECYCKTGKAFKDCHGKESV